MDELKKILKKLTPKQRTIVQLMSDSTGEFYIHWSRDIDRKFLETYTVTDGEDDMENLRQDTCQAIFHLPFIKVSEMPGTTTVTNKKLYIPENKKGDVFTALLQLE